VSVGVVLFTRDLRLHDNPVLWHAVHSHERVVPVFVLDAAILSGGFNRPNRAAFLADCLRDLDASLRARGAGLIIRGGDVVAETVKLARRVRADAVYVAGDVSGYAQRREQRLMAELECEVVVHEDALFAVPPGRIRPSGGAGHMSVFAAYYRRWRTEPRRDPLLAPGHIALPDAVARGRVPSARGICPGRSRPGCPRAGKAPVGPGWPPGCAPPPAATTRSTTTSPRTPPAGCPPICTSAACAASRSSSGNRSPRGPRGR
jgi:deoxyribodipyrimidine photo-lyase